MTVNFTKPITSDLRADVLSYIRDYMAGQAKMFAGETLVSAPTDTIRYNPASTDHERWNGSAWVQLPSLFARTSLANTFTQAQSFSSDATVAGYLVANRGAASLRFKPGSSDHTFMEFYARTSTPTTRSGWIGFGSAGSNDMSFASEVNGNLDFYRNSALNLRLGSDGVTRHYQDFRTRGQGRFNGWYGSVGSDENGAAVEVGVSAGAAYIYGYNRNTAAWVATTIGGSDITINANTGKIYTNSPIIVDTSGTNATFRNIEFRTTGQGLVGFGSFAGAWRPSLTLQGDTASSYMFMVGPADGGSSAIIKSNRGLDLRFSGTLNLTNDVGTALQIGNGNTYTTFFNWINIPASTGFYTSSSDYWYPDGSNYWVSRSPNGMKIQDRAGTTKGYVYFDGSGFGVLGNTGSWSIQIPPGVVRPNFPSNLSSDIHYGYTDTGKWLQTNDAALTYGAWLAGGSRSGYYGIALYDSWRYPTFMSNGSSAFGVYCQGGSYWSWYEQSDIFYITSAPYRSTHGHMLHFTGSSSSSGRVYVQNGGSPAGSVEGDITLIW